ncbi:class I SAM-dependent methyltransferase [Streptomyces violarus]|uniref:class I SAM-dependent methyltransferase n=1 Tax=Streptomyces violarus TaxID=67380 RepID=UPI0021BEAE00|nr:class I SAM-dependent methyltransferase [Streptomyces violarus]MCT9145236.1 class I SAM-dependent methyltransferase [Streptomyces violarus]
MPELPAPSVPQATAPVHEPRREDCPWCGSGRLRNRLRTGDLRQYKPGNFTVDDCRDCGHTFQNPRLTAEGLAHYRRTVRGAPRDLTADALVALRAGQHRHRSAARAMRPFGEPESWLDVGTGHARFPATAREFFPYTSFDGLDDTPSVVRAVSAERVEEAHVGRLSDPRISGPLRARYDVVSMLHHLEGAPDPRAELHAALRVLRPGGHLLIETLDPRSVFAALLGRWWLPYDQPRHLHLIPPRNLRAELETTGCTVLTLDHRPTHIPHDLSGATSLALSHALPAPDTPWRAIPPPPFQRHAREALLRAGLPLVGAAALADHLLAPIARRTRLANTYRVIARKPI